MEIPLVKRKSGDQKYDATKIVMSLMIETDLRQEIAEEIATDVSRFIISKHLQLLTAPLIREITNVCLLSKGYETGRLQYTRIGFPYYDIKKILDNPSLYPQQIVQHVIQEYEAVKQLIEGEAKK